MINRHAASDRGMTYELTVGWRLFRAHKLSRNHKPQTASLIRIAIALLIVLLLGLFPLKAYPDTYPATREYSAWIGSGVAVGYYSPVQPDFLSAGKFAWDVWQVPPYSPPGVAKIDWFADSDCQGKAEPAFISQSAWVLVWVSYGRAGVSSCSGSYNYIFINLACPYGGHVVVDQCYNAPPCPAPKVRDQATGACVDAKYSVTLTPDRPTIEPPGLPWNSKPTFTSLVAQVTQNGAPQQSVEVSLTVNVVSGSGGHLHHPDRSLGYLLTGAGSADCGTAGNPRNPCVTGVTAQDGKAEFIYVAPPLSGNYQFTATCAKCTNAASAAVTVKLDGLEQISASPGKCYTLTDAQGTIGAIDGQHTSNHWVRVGVSERLEEFACKYQGMVKTNKQVTDKRLFVNDASLIWGGLFEPHGSHRFGWSTDIRAESTAGKPGETPLGTAKKLLDIKKTKSGKVDVQIHCTKNGNIETAKAGRSSGKCDSYPANRHLHVDFK